MNQHSIILLNALPDKKIKSLGNKCLLNINKSSNILDYHIKIINKIFKNPEIIVVGGYDSKRLKKYIDNKYSLIKYIDHDIDNNTNIGTSILNGLSLVNNQSCLIWNSSFILKENLISIIKKQLESSFILTSNNNLGIGCIIDNNNIVHCYYDLNNHFPLEIIYLQQQDLTTFNKICNASINKLFFFEIINLCIYNNICLKPVKIPKDSFLLLDSINTINKMKTKHYV